MALMVLAYAAEVNQTSTYEDTVGATCGPVAKFFSVLCLVAFCFGSCTAYLTVVGDQTVDRKSNEHITNTYILCQMNIILCTFVY